MEFTIDSQKIPSYVYSASEKQTLSSQISCEQTVPDYSVDIARIIDCTATADFPQINADDGKITLSGNASFCVLYLSDKDADLHKFTFDSPYSAEADIGDADVLSAEAYAKEPIIRLSGSRRLSAKLDLELCIRSVAKTVQGYPEIPENTQIRQSEIPVTSVFALSAKPQRVSEDIPLPESFPPVAEILYCDICVGRSETAFRDGKLTVTANAQFCAVYSADDGSVLTYKSTLPLSQLIEYKDGDDNCRFTASTSVSGVRYGAGIDASGQSSVISLDFDVNSAITVYKSNTVCCVSDAYSTAGECTLDTATVRYARLSKVICSEFETSDSVSDDELEKVLFVRSKAQIRRKRMESGKLFCEGNCDAVIFAKTAVGGYGAYEHSIPFAYSTDIPDGADDADITVTVGGISWEQNGNNCFVSIHLKAEGTAFVGGSYECVTGISIKEANGSDKSPSLLIYYPDENETLWQIGKAHGVSVEKLCLANKTDEAGIMQRKFILIPKN